MQAIRYTLPLLFLVGSLIYGVMIIQLPQASLGNPHGPILFPTFVCFGIFVFSLIDLVSVYRQSKLEEENRNEDLEVLARKTSLKLILVIIAICLLYTLMFEWLGYLVSTIIFMALLMFYLNGLKKWVLNVTVSLIVSLSTWYAFTQLLEISLP